MRNKQGPGIRTGYRTCVLENNDAEKKFGTNLPCKDSRLVLVAMRVQGKRYEGV